MGCLPESGGCERHRTDPFVVHLNEVEGSLFIHRACLDRLYRDSPQPEALYSDSRSGDELVIERKTVVWPSDYAARHRNDHFIAERLFEELGPLAEGHALSIHLHPAARMSRNELIAFAREISDTVRAASNSLFAGRTIGSSKADRRWICFLDPEERPDDEPATGLIVSWTESAEMLSPDNLPTELAAQIRRLFQDTVEKFRNYPSARGMLLLDPYGAIRYTGSWWWARAFRTVPVPEGIAEVWLAAYDWVTNGEEGWTFERLHHLASYEGAAQQRAPRDATSVSAKL